MTTLEFPCRFCGEYEDGHDKGRCVFTADGKKKKYAPMRWSDAFSWTVENRPGTISPRAVPLKRTDVPDPKGWVN